MIDNRNPVYQNLHPSHGRNTTPTGRNQRPTFMHNAKKIPKKKQVSLNILLTSLMAIMMATAMLWTAVLPTIKDQDDYQYTSERMRLQAQKPSSLSSARRGKTPVTIAYVVSLIKCGDKQSDIVGLTDAACVLRHSVHQISIRNPASESMYDYKMYALVHTKAEKCSQPLADAGFEVVVRDTPFDVNQIQGDLLRQKIHKAWCCGADEFIKLYAYTFDEKKHPIVVHTDIDFLFLKPMDDLFDAMLFDKDSDVGQAARNRIPIQWSPSSQHPRSRWPDRVDAFFTRDWPQVIPGRVPGYQAGFLVTRPDKNVFQLMVDTILKGDYRDGFQRDSGWGGKGYCGFVGSMATQGLLAYVYDELLPGTWVELNQCRFNHMGMDVMFRSDPGFRPKHPKVGRCRDDQDICEDCMRTYVDLIYSIHYTQCRKPWNCIGRGSTSPQNLTDKERKMAIPEDSVNLVHCMKLLTEWHKVRSDLEDKLAAHVGNDEVATGTWGSYKRDVFQGHCSEDGRAGYLPIARTNGTLLRLQDLY